MTEEKITSNPPERQNSNSPSSWQKAKDAKLYSDLP